MAETLPHLLTVQAVERPHRVAIRHKQLGFWQQASWLAVQEDVKKAAQYLQQHGFRQGDTLFLLSEPRPEALLLSLASHWLGGVAAPLDPAFAQSQLLDLLHTLRPQFVFAEAQAQVDQVLAAKPDSAVVIYADARGLAGYQHPALVSYAQMVATPEIQAIAPAVTAEEIAFRFYRLSTDYALEYSEVSHAELLRNGRQLVTQEALTAHEEALAARAFAASGHAKYLLSPWLLAGFTLNFPENLATRDTDRRELGPTLVAGTATTYQRLYTLTQSRWPLPGSWQHRVVAWALRTAKTRLPLIAAFARWLVILPLQDVLGLRRTRVPLLVGEPLSAEATQFFADIEIHVRAWPEATAWQTSQLQVIPHQSNDLHSYLGLATWKAAI
ncbi:AMP-binding protein [Methylophilus sp. VKM B-3414]|uniref:AMP-binding protein n=1 Tax=Methylophilus sp. VKM B-3414 TaxID=3076121 RepID=UPI0028CA74BA|nr:AMP-binding protein [Methylophilus sp. VKM B-3414]MDT7848437.1 AMP-binding protein [Methylophilus sp. VKM B-3414]